jgi:site-specific DNA-methyltransferase (adenine-specific)
MINKVNNMKWEDGIKDVPFKSIACGIHDIPYGMDYQSNARKVKHEKIDNDDNLDWLPEWVFQQKRIMKTDGHLYVFCSWHKVDIIKRELSKQFEVKNILIWNKGGGGMGDLEGDYSPQYEMIIFCSNGSKALNGKRPGSIINFPKTNNALHPTQKPVELMRFFIENSSQKGDNICDTFSGSFPTLKAAKLSGRNAYCFEMKKKYCDEAKVIVDGMTIDMFSE